MAKRSIRTRWTFSLVSLALLPLLVLGGIISWKSYTTQIELTNKYQHEVARRVLSEVQLFIHELEAIFKMTIKVNDLNRISHGEQSVILAKLQGYRTDTHINLIQELSLVDRLGREKVRVDRAKVYTREEMREMSNAEIFLQPFKTGKVFYSQVLINRETGEPFITMSIPTTDLRSGTTDGVFIARIRL